MLRILYSIIILKIYLLKTIIQNRREKLFIETEEEKQKEKSDDIIIIHTNDVHCGFMDSIGYDGLMLYKKELQKKYKNVLTVDIGDHIQGDVIGLISKGLEIIDIMNKIGYDISALGDHEFDYGLNSLFYCHQKLNCGYISANYCYRKNKTLIFPPYKIINVGNKKIGFIGLTTHETLTNSYLHNIIDKEGNMIYDFISKNEGKDLYELTQKYINELKRKGMDYIIILDHIGFGRNEIYKITSINLLSNIYGIDAIIDGHTHRVYNITKKDKDGKDIILTQTGTKLSYIGVIKIKNNGEIISELIDKVPEPEEKENAKKIKRNNKEVWVDAEMNNYLINLENYYNEKLNQKIGYSHFDLIVKIDNKKLCRSEETTLGNLISDATRTIGKGQIALKLGGTIQDNLLKGDITYKKILNISPYSNEIINKEILGKDILDALELSVRYLPEKQSRFLQVSGMSFKVNISINSTVIVDEDETFVKVKGKRRVFDVKVGTEKLDINKPYKVSMNSYIGEGGDGFSMFRKYEIISSTSLYDVEVIILYINKTLNGNISNYYRKTKGRIIIYSNSGIEKHKNKSIFLLFFLIGMLSASIIFLINFIKKVKNQYFNNLTEEIMN